MLESSIRPDPQTDLHWSDYAGAIQDIFARNAANHPERVFVIETPSSTSPQREFTYWQIHQASNIVAHRLLQDGIQRGDVVMIYAYRGVDLVVAIFGTLKAGATFSVVDPAYPPDRQEIYLKVAQPRALIIIAKASRDEGRLSEQVKAYIKENLDLRSTIPDLELLDDGSLRGGAIADGSLDVLQEQQNLKDKHPGVVVGPDSQPTLSFTSGSEGIPKAVGGRHYSLTYYQQFMKDRFRMSENDRFTMLSGIAHDPIQRDVFTPAYLGAKLLVPSKHDIQHELLAQWMEIYKPSVSHLTPAMGQILVGGANAEFPSLKNAFFVGDILIKRDCRLLQSLAPNCRIINMFGTTETQRAVSFYEIPSRVEDPEYLVNMGDVIPAGKGMKDVQLLVVNRDSLAKGTPHLAEIGETGELFVRAGGLAEGYLGKDELTQSLNKEKFIPNFFVKNDAWEEADKRLVAEQGRKEPWREYWQGPRDRLYRSGDLGRYTKTGDVECTGRADSQVKIRGFRIELGEIDTHLSHHPLVRENVTLVRRNKDEEPMLVSYIVPDLQKWPQWIESKGWPDVVEDDTMVGMLKRFRILREDAKTTLKSKLPHYAVPSIIIPLRKMPLTPNAKIDKKALPFPDVAELAEASTAGKAARSSFSETEKFVGEVWAKRIPGTSADIIDLDDRFFDMGGHSMIGQSVLFDIRKRKGVSLSMNTLFQNPTLREFAAVLDAASSLTNGEKSDSTPPEMDYHLDGELLGVKSHIEQIPPAQGSPQTFLVTGATGFLGAHILADLLRRMPQVKVFAHVRASSPSDAVQRIKETCEAYGVWNPDWLNNNRIEPVLGDLSRPNLGIDQETWHRLAESVDCIIHNGARVHWVHTYTTLKPTNVLSTISLVHLCTLSRPKSLTFISSTAVLDTPAYTSTTSIVESDSLTHSRKGLTTGYGQTKYVSEYLVREAGKRGLRGCIVRPGYITGNADKGIGPTDDFLLRMLKGSIQLNSAPDLSPNTINLVPVSHCARIVVAASLHPPSASGVEVVQVTPHPQLPWKTFLGALQTYGYATPLVPYTDWRSALESYVANTSSSPATTADDIGNLTIKAKDDTGNKEPHALLPLFDWVTDNLPRDTATPTLLDTNAKKVLHADDPSYDLEKQSQVTEETVGMYLSFMIAIGFIDPPPHEEGKGKGKVLPKVALSETQRDALGRVGRK